MIRTLANRIVMFRSSSGLNNEFLRRFASILSVDILVKASGILLLPLFLRLMTQNEFGTYNYLVSICQTFSLVLNLGLYIPQSKLYHNYPGREERGSLLFTIFAVLTGFLFLITIIAFFTGMDDVIISVLFEKEPDSQYKPVLAFALLVTIYSYMLSNYFYTSEKLHLIRRYNIYRIVLVNLLALLALYVLPGDTVIVRMIVTYGVEFLLLGVFFYFLFRELVPRLNQRMMKKSLAMGLPIMVSAIFGIVVNFSDKFLLQKYGKMSDLSNYFLAFSFASVIPLVFASLQNVWLPIFMKERDLKRNMEKSGELVNKLLLVFTIISLLVWVLFAMLLWTGIISAEYSMVIWILPILLLTQIIVSITNFYGNYLVYFEQTKLVSYAGMLVSMLSVAFGLWLIPRYGVLGASLTTFTVNLVYLIIYYLLVIRIARYRLLTSTEQ